MASVGTFIRKFIGEIEAPMQGIDHVFANDPWADAEHVSKPTMKDVDCDPWMNYTAIEYADGDAAAGGNDSIPKLCDNTECFDISSEGGEEAHLATCCDAQSNKDEAQLKLGSRDCSLNAVVEQDSFVFVLMDIANKLYECDRKVQQIVAGNRSSHFENLAEDTEDQPYVKSDEGCVDPFCKSGLPSNVASTVGEYSCIDDLGVALAAAKVLLAGALEITVRTIRGQDIEFSPS